MKYLAFILSCLCLHAHAGAPYIEASYETTPIPAGVDSTDDVALWLSPETPARSLIIGVSKTKTKDGNHAGLGLYDLQGQQLVYLEHDRLNNVDLKYGFKMNDKSIDIAVASNRDKKALSIFHVSDNSLQLLADLPLLNHSGKPIDEEPYGLCLSSPGKSGGFFASTPMKSGIIYQHELRYNNGALSLNFSHAIDTSLFLNRDQQQHLIDITLKEVILEKERPRDQLIEKLSKKLNHRFQLEGCVVDDEKQILYFGMENLGVWKLALNKHPYQAKLIAQVQYAKSEIKKGTLAEERSVFTTDIEGLALHYGANSKGALLVSVQGLNEYAWIDRETDRYLGSFKLTYGSTDPVTETDGLDILSTPLGKDFPSGILVVHDHHNTDTHGDLQNANYKIISLDRVLEHFSPLQFKDFSYNPRQ